MLTCYVLALDYCNKLNDNFNNSLVETSKEVKWWFNDSISDHCNRLRSVTVTFCHHYSHHKYQQ